MELLHYEPGNTSRGSSLLDDTDGDLKVNSNRETLREVNLNLLTTFPFIPRTRSSEAGTECTMRWHKRGMIQNSHSKNQDPQHTKKIQFSKLLAHVNPLLYLLIFYLLPIHCQIVDQIGSIFCTQYVCRMLV